MDSTKKEGESTSHGTRSTQPLLRSRRLDPEVKLENCAGSKVTEAQQADSKMVNRGKKRKVAGDKKEIKGNKLKVKKDEGEVIEKLSDLDPDFEEVESDMDRASEIIKKTVYKKAHVSAEKELEMKLKKYRSLVDSKDAVGAQIEAAQEEIDSEKQEIEKKVKLETAHKAELKQSAEEIVEIEIDIEVKRAVLERLENKLMQKQVEKHLSTKSLESQQESLRHDHDVLEAMNQEQEERREWMIKVEQQMKDLLDGVGEEKAAAEAAVLAEEVVAAERDRQKARNMQEARLEYLQQEITKLEKELECPLCFYPCVPPIYSCKAQHLVCSTCRPQLGRCGECRARYRSMVRHRYAERDHGTLRNKQGEHWQLTNQLQLDD